MFSVTLLPIIMLVLFMLIAGALAALGVWTYRDAKARGLEAGMWTAVVVLVPNFIGLLLYFLIGRKQARAACPYCHNSTLPGQPFCAVCGASIAGAELQSPPPATNNKKPMVIAIVCSVLAFMLLLVMTGLLVFQPSVTLPSSTGVGMVEKSWGNEWSLQFYYLNGSKSHVISPGSSTTLSITGAVEQGELEIGISANGEPETRVSLQEKPSPYEMDITPYAGKGPVTLTIYASEARGHVEFIWS